MTLLAFIFAVLAILIALFAILTLGVLASLQSGRRRFTFHHAAARHDRERRPPIRAGGRPVTDDKTLVAELREVQTNYELACEFSTPVTWAQQTLLVALIARAADCIEALEARECALVDQVKEQFARAEKAEQERDALKAELEVRLNGPTAERYRLERDALAAAIAEALDVLLSAAPRDVLREHDERVASAAVIGVQGWMAADLGSALGHADQTEVNNGERSWADWWARLLHEVREHDERVKSEAAARALRDFADAHRMPNDWILFIGPDESTVTVNDLLRETAARIEGSKTE